MTDVTVTELGERGRRLWDDMRGNKLDPSGRVLLEEACRIADRLDRLDRQLRGDSHEWMRFHSRNEDGSIVRVVMTGALAEARQQQVALKTLLTELRQGQSTATKPTGSASGKGVPAGVTDLTTWAPTRSAKPAG